MTIHLSAPGVILHGLGVAFACGPNGELQSECLHGFFAGDTRVLSTYRISVSGHAWQLLGRTRRGRGSAEWTFQNPRLRGAEGDIASGTLFFRLRRRVEGSLHDDFTIRNFGCETARFRLSLLIDADFADIFLVKDQSLRAAVGVARYPIEDGLRLTYERKDFQRGLRLTIFPSRETPAFSGSGISFDLALQRGSEWTCCIEATPEIDRKPIEFVGDPHVEEAEPVEEHGHRPFADPEAEPVEDTRGSGGLAAARSHHPGIDPREDSHASAGAGSDATKRAGDAQTADTTQAGGEAGGEARADPRGEACGDARAGESSSDPRSNRVTISALPLLERPFRRGQTDLCALAIKHGPLSYVAAGAPWFLTLFGRDSLMTALMSGIAGTWPAEGALAALAEHQATVRDDWRDAEPGKLPHEVRRGELSHFAEIPHSAYYGSHDAPALYCLALWHAWRWTGRRDLLEKHFQAAVRALRWCETLGDRDQDGFLEYESRSSHGYRNQGWKDAGDAIVHADGSLASTPLATVELQGYFYAARLAMAELHREMGNEDEATRLLGAAESQRIRVEDAFWMEEEGFYALALDGNKRKVEAISSNPGHLLWCGLPSPDRARRVAERMMRRDMSTGWGLRTLSAAHPAFNPLSYQLGSVWPFDTALAASGFWRYGLFEPAEVLLRGVLQASRAFEQDRLPELFCGFDRTEGLPVPYEKANAPQAWSAAVPLLCAQLFLGIVPDAPRRRCYLSPHLPSWLPYLEVRGIRIGDREIDIRLRGDGAIADIERLNTGGLEVRFEAPAAPLWGIRG